MTQGALAPPARREPLLIVAELPPAIHGWADALRREHYPPERNRLGAHVTLFHGLPPSAEGAVLNLLGDLARLSPPEARIVGLMDLGTGTALAVDSRAMTAIHAEMAERLHGLIQQRDAAEPQLHITIQNKVTVREARALQAELSAAPLDRGFRFHGFALHRWTGEIWRRDRLFPFRGTTR